MTRRVFISLAWAGGFFQRAYPRAFGCWIYGLLLLAPLLNVPAQAAEMEPLRLLPPVFSGQELWLNLEGAAPSGIYDIFTTTNLNGSALWRWQARSAFAGQTNFVLANGSGSSRFFLLGTMLDSDGEGLTDAFEELVTGKETGAADTDGDGVNDYIEHLQGRNPHAGAVDAAGAVGLRVYTPGF